MAHGPDALDLPRIEDTRSAVRALRQETIAQAIGKVRQRLGPGTTRTLSLFVPGLSQILRGQTTLGLFFFTAIAFCAALARATLATLGRLLSTVELLGLPQSSVVWLLGLAYSAAAILHLTGVYVAAGPRLDNPHPAVSGAASLAVPGWGQLLNGDRRRAMAFLAGVWVVVGARILTSEPVTSLLNAHAPVVRPWEQWVRAPESLWLVHWTLPVALWCVAVYDAVASTAIRRKLEAR